MERKRDWKSEIGNKRDGFFHHAYAVLGIELSELEEYLEREFHVSFLNDPDVHEWQGERFYLDDAHDIIRKANSRAFLEGSKKIFLIDALSMLRESQNALLKTIEEPPENTFFFFLLPTETALLSTIVSRVLCINARTQNISKEELSFAKKFSGASQKDRLVLIAPIIENKDKEKALNFLNALELCLHEEMHGALLRKELEVFHEIRKARSYLSDTSPSLKMLLEHIALCV